jgi:citrate lyase subunit beta/citryl-CoA lyase
MDYRSWLFVPADQPRKVESAATGPADAIILDLEDAVGLVQKDAARALVVGFLAAGHGAHPCGPARLIRVNALSTGMTEADVAATARHRPAGYVLPKCEGPADVDALARLVATHGGSDVPILAIATETARAVRSLMRSDWSHPALGGLTWGGEDLMADLGSLRNRKADGSYHSPFRLVRDLTLFAASEARVPAVDAVYTAFRDEAGLKSEAGQAADLGFSGKLAIHPAQIAPIHAAFAPDETTIAHAQRVREVFASSGGNATSLDGEMLDIPHLRRAMRILQRASAN